MSNLRHLIRGISQLDVKSKGPDTDETRYDKYIARLKAPLSLAESVTTAHKLVAWINQYQLGNPSQPWLVSRRLVKSDMPSNARLAGLQLFKACVESRSDLPAVVRLMFFQDIEVAFSKEDFDLQIEAFIALTKDGRDISGFEMRVCSVLARWVDRALINLDNRKPFLRRLVPVGIQARHQELRQVIAIIDNVVKYHFSILEEAAVSLLVERIILTCKRTGEAEDIQAALTFLDITIRYGYIPAGVLTEVVCVICSIHHALDMLGDAALLVMRNLLRSHMSQGTLQALRRIILGWSNVHDDVILGALGILTTRWTQNYDEHANYTFTLDALFLTYKEGLASPQTRPDRNQVLVDSAHIRSIRDILSNTSLVPNISFDDWIVLFDIFDICTRSLRADFPSATRIDDSSDILSLKALYGDLLQALERQSTMDKISMPIARLASLWTKLGTNLRPQSAMLLLEYHVSEFSFFPSNPTWLSNLESLSRDVFMTNSQSQNVKLRFLSHLQSVTPLLDQEDERDRLHLVLLSLLRDIQKEPHLQSSAEASALIFEILEQGSETNAKEAQNIILAILLSTTAQLSRNSDIRTIVPITPDMTSQPAESISSSSAPGVNLLEQHVLDRASRVFIQRFGEKPNRTVPWLFDVFCIVIEDPSAPTGIKLQILSILAALRADSDHQLYIDLTIQDQKSSITPVEVPRPQPHNSVARYSCKDSSAEDYLPVDRYLTILLRLIHHDTDRAIIAKVLFILQDQLGNRPLFCHALKMIEGLRHTICERLCTVKPPAHFQEDIVGYVQVIAMLVGYHDSFTKIQEDEIVAALQNTLMRYQRATQACIRSMVVCAYELPLSTTKNLPSILIRMSQLVTSTNVTIQILDFLSALATLPSLYINFREDDYRRVFGIALQHIQHANAMSREAILQKQADPMADPMTAYVFSLAFDALCAWFLAVRLGQRSRYLKWIVDGLLAANPNTSTLDSRSLACYDFLVRFCYSNSEIRSSTSVLKDFEANQSSMKSWIHGNSIVTMKTMNLSGLTEITVRRPSGSTSYLCKPNSDLEALSLISSVDARNIITSDALVGPTESRIRSVIAGLDNTAYTPSHILLQTSVAPDIYLNEKPIVLLDDDITRRALATLDRIPVVDFHKIGVIYVGRGQSLQSEILANTYGTPEYVHFLEGLGELVRLKDNASIYTGGLDTRADEDGEFAYTYREKITQVIFHTCTLMPYRPEVDPESTRKKSHIGNDFVKIIWNSSNKPFDIHTIPSEFNFINIIVSPDAYQTTKYSGLEKTAGVEEFYKIKIASQHDLPDISPVSQWRLISASKISTFVRTIAIHCNIYAQIYHAHGTYTGTWNQRLKRIEVLRQRTLAKVAEGNTPDIVTTGYDFTAYN